jgi:hypothetical protein
VRRKDQRHGPDGGAFGDALVGHPLAQIGDTLRGSGRGDHDLRVAFEEIGVVERFSNGGVARVHHDDHTLF